MKSRSSGSCCGAESGGDTRNAFPRTPRADRFPRTELAALVARLNGGGISFLPIDQFADRLRGAPGGFGLLKLDIHRGIHRVQEVGRLLKEQSVHGLFLMMHRHALNADYYDAPCDVGGPARACTASVTRSGCISIPST